MIAYKTKFCCENAFEEGCGSEKIKYHGK